jgi:hypothetical protein
MHRQFEYRRRRTRREIFEAAKAAMEARSRRPYEEMRDDEINGLVISRIMKWECCRDADDPWPKWRTPSGNIVQGPEAAFSPATNRDHAFCAYNAMDGPHELSIEELKIPGPPWYVGIEIYEPKPEKTISEKGHNLARTMCVAMLKTVDADPRMQKCSVCGHQPRHVDDLCEHVRGPL